MQEIIKRFKIVKDIIWEVLEFEDGRWNLCNIFVSKKKAKEYIKEREWFDAN